MSFALLKRTRPAAPLPEERLHEVAGRSLPLKVVENARARRLTLRIEPAGTLRMTVPPGMPAREIDRFLARHRGWLEERLAKLPDQPQVRPGIKLPFRGAPHAILHEPSTRGTVLVGHDETGGPALVVHGDRRHLPRRLADFLKRQARAEIEPLVMKHTAAVGRRAKAIRYRDTVSRWGSCTADGTLSFSWRIMMAPPAVIDYLVAHEVAHLKEMNHGPKFWKLCETLCPRTKEARAWLKRNGNALQAIRFEG
jgi:predicted metal-dependent hydrolase